MPGPMQNLKRPKKKSEKASRFNASKGVEPRRKWIEKNVKFTLEEDGSLLDTAVATSAHGDASNKEDQEIAQKSLSLFDDDLDENI